MEKILLVEDDIALGRGVFLALNSRERSIEVVQTLAEARKKCQTDNYDLLILDINLPDGNGLDLLSWLRSFSDVPVMILTANDLETDQVADLELGADDYVTKPFSLAILRARVATLLRRSNQRGNVYHVPPFLFDFDSMQFSYRDNILELSKTEQRLLRLFVENRGQTLKREQLLERVWDGGEFVDENALSVAVKRLRDKLVEAPIKTVYGLGYVWEVK